ncbi:MAG TPA: hypothetical protein VD767_09690, partial [Thermomicrobiales bacterium]|nr:hypothetical protein [Thermomicrobiales bacterium]
MSEEKAKDAAKPQPAAESVKPEPVPEPVQKHHIVAVGGTTLDYTTTCGQLPIRNDKGEVM